MDYETIRRLYLDEKKGSVRIAKELDCKPGQITYLLKKYKIPVRNIVESQEIFRISKDELYRWYIIEKLTMVEIAKKVGCSNDSIRKKLKKFKITQRNQSEASRTFSKNDEFFSEPSVLNSYWAGFIAADGCITLVKGGQNRLSIHLKRGDEEILLRFKNDIQFTGNIWKTVRKPPRLSKNKYLQKEYYQSCLQINSADQISKDLEKHWNITPRKSLTLQPPNLTELKYKLAYIIGYIDGDGCISKYLESKDKYNICLSMVGNKDILDWISNVLYNLEDSRRYKNPVKSRQKQNNKAYEISYMSIRGKTIINKLLEFIKDNNLKVLNRKWEKQ